MAKATQRHASSIIVEAIRDYEKEESDCRLQSQEAYYSGMAKLIMNELDKGGLRVTRKPLTKRPVTYH